MAQLAIKNLSKLAPFAGEPWDLPHKFHLYLIVIPHIKRHIHGKTLTVIVELCNDQLATMLVELCNDQLLTIQWRIFWLPALSWYNNFFFFFLELFIKTLHKNVSHIFFEDGKVCGFWRYVIYDQPLNTFSSFLQL